jgi:hypothetical protein
MTDADNDKKEFELRAFAVEKKMRGKRVTLSELSEGDFLAWARVKRAAETLGAGCTHNPCEDDCQYDGDEPGSRG